MDSKDQNFDLTRTKRIHFNPFSFAGILITILKKKSLFKNAKYVPYISSR